MWYRLRRFWAGLNKGVLACTLLLLVVGWMLVVSATLPPGQNDLFPLPQYAFRQSIWMALGLVVLLLAATLDYHVLLRLAAWIYSGGLLLLALVLGVGITSFGARRWFAFGEVFIQPGEFVKLGVLLMVVKLAATVPPLGPSLRRARWPRWLAVSALVVGVPMALIAGQPNLGTAMLLLVSTAAIWIVAGVPMSLLGIAAAGSALASPFVWAVLKDYQRARILNFLNPFRDPLGGGYAVIQSTTAIGSGGLLGRGWLNGTQNRLEYIPKHHTDFIVSVLGEEAGWLGCLFVLMLYLVLFLEALRVAHRARDLHGTYLAVGVVALMATQMFVNIGMNVGMVPVMGLPLPLLSYGGSSLLMSMVFLGIVLNIGRQERR